LLAAAPDLLEAGLNYGMHWAAPGRAGKPLPSPKCGIRLHREVDSRQSSLCHRA